MRRILFSILFGVLLLLSGCDWLAVGEEPSRATSQASSTETPSTLPPKVTLPLTEPPTTEAGEFPNDPDEGHSKRY